MYIGEKDRHLHFVDYGQIGRALGLSTLVHSPALVHPGIVVRAILHVQAASVSIALDLVLVVVLHDRFLVHVPRDVRPWNTGHPSQEFRIERGQLLEILERVYETGRLEDLSHVGRRPRGILAKRVRYPALVHPCILALARVDLQLRFLSVASDGETVGRLQGGAILGPGHVRDRVADERDGQVQRLTLLHVDVPHRVHESWFLFRDVGLKFPDHADRPFARRRALRVARYHLVLSRVFRRRFLDDQRLAPVRHAHCLYTLSVRYNLQYGNIILYIGNNDNTCVL